MSAPRNWATLNEPVQVRQALESDASGIATVHVSAWQAAYRGIVPDAYLDSLSVEVRANVWREALTRGEPKEVWVATVGSDVAGWIAFGPSREANSTATTGELEAVYVSAQYWGAGVGRELWLTARNRLAARGFTRVTLWVLLENTRAIRFYRAAGFAPDPASEKQINIGGRLLMEMRYEISLA
jgi:ribosomal protein S18 acetylase RimI-like enzyme